MRPAQPKNEDQLRIFDNPRRLSYGSVRNVCGSIVERIACGLFGGRRIKTTGRHPICPYIKTTGGVYLECKSSGRGSQVVVYCSRIEKEKTFVSSGHRLRYFIVSHSLKLTKGKHLVYAYEDDLINAYLDSIEYAILLPFCGIYAETQKHSPRVVNSSLYAGGGENYRNGWTLRLGTLTGYATGRFSPQDLRTAYKLTEIPPLLPRETRVDGEEKQE